MVPTPEFSKSPETQKLRDTLKELTDLKKSVDTGLESQRGLVAQKEQEVFNAFLDAAKPYKDILKSGDTQAMQLVEDKILAGFSSADKQEILRVLNEQDAGRTKLMNLQQEVTPGQGGMIADKAKFVEGKLTEFIAGAKKNEKFANMINLIGEDNLMSFAKGIMASFLESMAKFAPNMANQSSEIRWANEINAAKKNAKVMEEIAKQGGEEAVKTKWMDKYMEWVQRKSGDSSFTGAMPTLRDALKPQSSTTPPAAPEKPKDAPKDAPLTVEAKEMQGMKASFANGKLTIEKGGNKFDMTKAVETAAGNKEFPLKGVTVLAKKEAASPDMLRLAVGNDTVRTVDIDVAKVAAANEQPVSTEDKRLRKIVEQDGLRLEFIQQPK